MHGTGSQVEDGDLGTVDAERATLPRRHLGQRSQPVPGGSGAPSGADDGGHRVGTEPDEKLMGSAGKEINQVEDYRLPADGSGEGSGTAGRDPGQLSDAHRYQYEDFLAALHGKGEVRVGLAENRQSISVIVGAYESARTGQPVRLA